MVYRLNIVILRYISTTCMQWSHLWIHQEDSTVWEVPGTQHTVGCRDPASYILQERAGFTNITVPHMRKPRWDNRTYAQTHTPCRA